MSFLNPALLGFLFPLLALPLAIHLLNQGFPRLFKFPSVDLIKETVAQRSRLHRWRHLILLFLRTAFLLLLLVAFLQPVLRRFGADPAATGGRHVLIVLDHSASMEHQGDGPTSRERAVHEALKLMDSLSSEDAVNILLLDASPSTCFVEFSDDVPEARRFLHRLRPGLGRADVNLANSLAARLVARDVSRPEIYYLSDFQRRNWANASFTAIPPAARLFFVDVGAARRDNRGILDARVSQSHILAGDSVMFEITVGNYAREPFQGRLSITVDKRFGIDQEVSIPAWSESRVLVPVPAGGAGLHLCQIRLPPDALELDDTFSFSLSVREKEEVLIVSDGDSSPRSGAYFLKTALNPFENEAGSLLPRAIPSGDLSASRLAGVGKVFLTQVHRLNEEAAAAVARFLFQGGGIVYFLDGPADAENLASIEKTIGPDSMPLRLARRRTATNLVAGAQQVVRGDFRSRYLKLFQGDGRQNLALLEFYDYYQASASGRGGVLLEYGDESPAMAAVHHGLGTMLLLNFSASEFSSNLARQRIFPAWMQELVKAVSADEPPRTAYSIGETLHTEVWRSEMRELGFKDPSGTPVTVKRELSGDRYSVSFTPEQLGFYTLGSSPPLYAFGVNGSSDEIDLRPIEKEVLPKEFAADRPAQFLTGADDFDELAHGRPLFHWFVLAGAVVLLIETGFQCLVRRKAVAST